MFLKCMVCESSNVTEKSLKCYKVLKVGCLAYTLNVPAVCFREQR